ncbi:calmodulin-binding protein 60 B-like [Hibiscus syriacus]|uniref:calmodulin-binding protein 60 B-like n=1 Tax=Hibiscus syriacus TaxID=106335 RepID=UPI0019221FC6|nr:calmodulin-binding protein 60 B-like [Hibiscus syriacus]
MQRIPGESTIREATSEAFMVKDHRGELWRLERIAKDGAFHKRLTSKNIFTVKDFLRLHVTDPSALHDILGSGISNRVWDTIIDHALSCILDDEWYSYYGTAQSVGLLLDSIYRVVAATLDGENYHLVEKFTFSQKLLVEDAKRQAYKNVQYLVLVDRRATTGPSMPLTDLLPEPLSVPNLLLQQSDFSVENQDEPDTSNSNFNQSSTSYAYEMKDANQLQVSLPHDEPAIKAFNPTLRNSFRLGGIFQSNGENSLSFFTGDHFATEDNSQAQMPIWTSTTPAWGLPSGSNILTLASESSVGTLYLP